jgi:hypothetical protein
MRGAAASAFGIGRPQGGAEPTEELPPMRAVSLMSPAPGLQVSARPQFGKAPPPLGSSRPGHLSGKTELKRASSGCIAVEQEWNESNWHVCDLEQVPLDFPLERTHREIRGADSAEVAKRISKTLRLLSVEAEYDGEKAKAKCTTSDMVSFRIRLFSGGDDGLPVVVEVQRRNGPPSSFMRVCRHILDGAEGCEIKAETTRANRKMPPFMKGAIGGMKCLQSAIVKSDPEADLNNGLNKSMDLLRSKQKDANLLGLENLCHLTDPLKTRPDIALKACKAVILEKKCVEIREEVAVMLQKDAFLPEEFDDDDATSLVEKSRHLALVLLSNILLLTSKDGCLTTAVKSDKWFADYLIPSLLDEVKSYETSANNANEAAFGLTSLATCSDLARRVMEENSAFKDLQSAYQFGLQNHELLANETERALNAMRKSV